MPRLLLSCVGLIAFFAVAASCAPEEKKPEYTPSTSQKKKLDDLMEGSGSAGAKTTKPGDPSEIIPKPPVEPPSVSFKEVDWEGLQMEIAAHKGKTVVVDCWATWCTTCKAKFPKYVELAKSYAERSEIVFVNLANDEDAEKNEEIKDFVTKSGSSMPTYRLGIDPGDFATNMQVDGVPAYIIYDPSGVITFRSNSIDELTEAIKERFP